MNFNLSPSIKIEFIIINYFMNTINLMVFSFFFFPDNSSMVVNWKKNKKSLWEWRIILWKPPPRPCKLKKNELGLGLIIHLNGSNFEAWWVCSGNESVMLAKPQILNLRFGALLWCGILKGQVCIDICKQFVWGVLMPLFFMKVWCSSCTKEPFSLIPSPIFTWSGLLYPHDTTAPRHSWIIYNSKLLQMTKDECLA